MDLPISLRSFVDTNKQDALEQMYALNGGTWQGGDWHWDGKFSLI